MINTPAETTTNSRRMTLNMGPQHPSTHGVLRVVLELDGEIVTSAQPEIGFLHTGIEKQCEALTYQQLWAQWENGPLAQHVANLKKRYEVT